MKLTLEADLYDNVDPQAVADAINLTWWALKALMDPDGTGLSILEGADLVGDLPQRTWDKSPPWEIPNAADEVAVS